MLTRLNKSTIRFAAITSEKAIQHADSINSRNAVQSHVDQQLKSRFIMYPCPIKLTRMKMVVTKQQFHTKYQICPTVESDTFTKHSTSLN